MDGLSGGIIISLFMKSIYQVVDFPREGHICIQRCIMRAFILYYRVGVSTLHIKRNDKACALTYSNKEGHMPPIGV